MIWASGNGGLNTWPVLIIQRFVFHHILKQKQWISAASIFSISGFWCTFQACTHPFARAQSMTLAGPLSLFSTGWNFKDPGELGWWPSIAHLCPTFCQVFSLSRPRTKSYLEWHPRSQRLEGWGTVSPVSSWIFLLHFATGYGRKIKIRQTWCNSLDLSISLWDFWWEAREIGPRARIYIRNEKTMKEHLHRFCATSTKPHMAGQLSNIKHRVVHFQR